MDTKNIKELINKARSSSHPEEVQVLLNDFEAFADLYNQKDQAADPEAFKEQVFSARDQFLASFNKIAESFGMTPETILNYYENPNNFSNEEWEKLQEIKEEMNTPKVRI